MSAPIEADGPATLNRARDNLKLKPDSLYTGGHGPNPFLGPATAEDPCSNSAVTKSNDFAASVLSTSKQALAVSQAISGNITKMESVNLGSAKTLLRELAPYSEVNDPEQVKRLYHYAIGTKAQLELDTFAKLSNLRGEFLLTVVPATEFRRASVNLDLLNLSVSRFIDLVETHIIPQLNKNTAEQTQLPMKMQVVTVAQGMAKQLMDTSLANCSSVAGIADTMVTFQSAITNNRKLEDYIKSTEGDLSMGEELAKALKVMSNKDNERFKARYQWFVQHIPIIDKVNGSTVRISFKELQADLMQTFLELSDAWQQIKGFLSKDQKDAIAMPHDELHRRLLIRDEVLKKHTQLQQFAGTKRSNEQSSSSSSSSSSSVSYADKVKGPGKPGDVPREDSSGNNGSKKKKSKTGDHTGDKNDSHSKKPSGDSEKSELPTCSGCGNGHKYHDQPGYVCPYLKHEHPQANTGEPTKAWAESKAGKAFKTRSGLNRLPFGKAYASDDATELTDFRPMSAKKAAPKGKPFTDKSILDRNPFTLMCALNNDVEDDFSASARTTPFLTIPVVSLSNDRRKVTRELHVKTGLVDTGAVDSDYVSKRLAERLVKDFGVHVHPDTTAVNTPFDKLDSVTCLGRVEFNIKIFNEMTRQNEFIILDARIIESPLDIIIGRPSIRKNGLLRKCHDQILMDTRVTNIEEHNVTLATYFNNDLWLQLNMIKNADAKNHDDDDDSNKMEIDDNDDDDSSTGDEKIETLSSTQTLPRCTLADGRTCQCWSL